MANKYLWRHKSVTHMKRSICAAIMAMNADSKYIQVSRESELLTKKKRVIRIEELYREDD